MSPARLTDTRSDGETIDDLAASTGMSAAGAITELAVLNRGGVPGDATSVVLNVVATEPTVAGFLTVFPCGQQRPLASSLNFEAGQTVANAVISKVGANGAVCIFSSQAVHLVADVDGFYVSSSGYTSMSPARLLDSRPGEATFDGQSAGLGLREGGSVTELVVGGRAGVPADASAVVLNVVATEPVSAGFVTVYPCGTERPLASTLNYVRGQTVANLAISKLGIGGKVCLFTSQASHVIVDVSGFGAASATYESSVPARILESRSGQGSTIDGQFTALGARVGGSVTELVVGGRAGVAANASAVALNVTVTEPAASGFVTVYPCGSAKPLASSLNYGPQQSVANLVVTKLGTEGKVCIFSSQPLHLVVDEIGYFKS